MTKCSFVYVYDRGLIMPKKNSAVHVIPEETVIKLTNMAMILFLVLSVLLHIQCIRIAHWDKM